MGIATRAAGLGNVAAWLEIVAEVEALFGPMPTFEDSLRRAIDRRTATVAIDQGEVAGGVLLSAEGRPHRIQWLAVRQSRRGHGVGAALVASALERWPAGDVEVVTFPAEMAAGRAARKLYEKFGFVCCGRAQKAPNGDPRDLFVLSR